MQNILVWFPEVIVQVKILHAHVIVSCMRGRQSRAACVLQVTDSGPEQSVHFGVS